MTARVTLTDFCNSVLRPLEILDISLQLQTDALSAVQEVIQFHLTVYDKSMGRAEIAKVTYKAINNHWRCNALNNYCYCPLILENTSKQCDSALTNAYLLRQQELNAYPEHG